MISQLSKLYPKSFNNYFEPFVGGGAVFLSTDITKKSYINDINSKLMRAYLAIKNDPQNVINQLCDIEEKYNSLNHSDQKDFFYKSREEFNTPKDITKETALLIFLNKTCFNGLYRENKSGNFNVPFGNRYKVSLCHPDNIKAISQKLQETEILNTDYVSAVEKAKSGDFIYFDPPYFPLNLTSSFTSYSKDDFSAKDQQNLANLYRELDKRGCKLMLSNSNTKFIEKLYTGFRQEKVSASRNINANGNGRSKIDELVILNYDK